MDKTDPRCRHFVQALREELVPAMGCTEPIANIGHLGRFGGETPAEGFLTGCSFSCCQNPYPR